MTMKIGGLEINSMEFNGKSVENVWLGNDLVWTSFIPDIQLDYFTLPVTTEFFKVTDGELDLIPYADVVKYTGSSVSPNLHGYVPDFMTLSGTTSAVSIGTYTCTLTLPTGYYFKSTGNSSINISWEIVPYYNVQITTGGSGLNYFTYVEINGVRYQSSTPVTVNVPKNTTVSCFTTANSDVYASTYIQYNGTQVASGTSTTPASYSFTVTSDTNVTGAVAQTGFRKYYGYIQITTS